MQLSLERSLTFRYKNSSQKIRVMTEDWVNKEVYCPNCASASLKKYSNNRPVADFFCENCNEDFELKSKRDPLGSKLVD